MKIHFLLLTCLFFQGILAQDLEGSWLLIEENEVPVKGVETVRIFQDGYVAFAAKEKEGHTFLEAGGGPFFLDGSTYRETYDFYTPDSTKVGTQKEFQISSTGDQFTIRDGQGTIQTWERLSNDSNVLSGNWVITGRKRDGTLRRSTPGARRTIKILGGGRFQWAAFNSDTGEFFGTGGGTYTAEEGRYTETIKFFSRDDSRAGAQLPFTYELKEGEWIHSGTSSKGVPLYEIWSPYKKAYRP